MTRAFWRLLPAHVLALVLVAAAGWLGSWQLDAWRAQRAAEARDLTAMAAVPLVDLMGPDDPFPGDQVGRPVTAEGSWLPQGTLFVSGRADGGRDGYWVVTPLAVGGPDEPAVLVVRGWSPDPAAPAVSGDARLEGWLQPPEGTGAFDDDPDDDVVPQLRIADAVQRVDQDLYGAYVVATTPTAGLAAASLDSLPEVGPLTALKNLLYAFEWWFFGLFAAFVWWRWTRDQQVGDDPPSDAG